MEAAAAIDRRQVGRNVVMTAAIAGLGGPLLGKHLEDIRAVFEARAAGYQHG